MYENKQQQQTAVLAAVDTGEYDVQRSVDELEELAKSAGAEVLGRMIQRKDRPDPATLMGAGRLEELADFVRSSEAELVIFDHELAPAQQKNIEKVVDVPVIDRTTLILDIFAQRAKTSAGRLQVELAQLKYRLPRLSGLGTSLSRLGGGIGTRGPGESKLESDRRHIRRRIHALEQELEALEKHRDLLRQRRKKDDVITVAIVGYTNVGKSTLLNTLPDLPGAEPTGWPQGDADRHGWTGQPPAAPAGTGLPFDAGGGGERGFDPQRLRCLIAGV